MEKKILFTVFLWFCCFCTIKAQVWPKYYGLPNRKERAQDIIETYDKGYLILGSYPQFSWLIKTDINGNILWEKIIDNEPNPVGTATALATSGDGGILVCGIALSGFSNKYCPFVMKLNACGEKEWCKIFEGSPNAFPNAADIKETDNGDIVVLVNMYGQSPYETIHLFKLNASGDVLWKEAFATIYNYPNTNIKYGRKLLITNDNKYLISGYGYWEQPWNPGGPMPMTSLFIMSDSDGNEEWVLPFGLSDTIIGKARQTLDIIGDVFLGTSYNWPNTNLIEPCYMVFNRAGYELNYTIIKPYSINNSLLQGSFDESQLINGSVFSGGSFILNYSQETIVDCRLHLDTNNLVLYPNINLLHQNNMFPYSNSKTLDNKILSNSSFRNSSTNYDIFLTKLNLNLEYDTAYTLPITYDSLCTSGPPQSGFIYLSDCAIDMNLPGDANCDAAVNVHDVVSSVAKILGGIPQPFCPQNADVNGDGVLNVADVVGTVNIIMSRRGRY